MRKEVSGFAGLGIRCPNCSGEMREVIDSRRIPFAIRRRRACMHCDHRHSTQEILVQKKKKHNR